MSPVTVSVSFLPQDVGYSLSDAVKELRSFIFLFPY